MNQDKDSDWLDALLDEPAPYIADDGFTEAVVARLPASPRRGVTRALVQAAAVLVAAGLFLVLGGGSEGLLALVAPLLTPLSAGVVPVLLALAGLAGVVWWPLILALED